MENLYKKALVKKKELFIEILSETNFDTSALDNNPIMAKGFDREKAYLLLTQIDMLRRMADKLDYPSIAAVAQQIHVSPTTLRALWKELNDGDGWDDKRRYELIIREKVMGKNRTKNPRNNKKSPRSIKN